MEEDVYDQYTLEKIKDRRRLIRIKHDFKSPAENSHLTSMHNTKTNSWFKNTASKVRGVNSKPHIRSVTETRSMKYKIQFLDKDEERKFRNVLGVYRKTYNIAVKTSNDTPVNQKLNLHVLRQPFNDSNLDENNILKSIPYSIRRCALAEVHTSHNTNVDTFIKGRYKDIHKQLNNNVKYLNNTNKEWVKDIIINDQIDLYWELFDLLNNKSNLDPFKLKFRKRKNPKQSINFEKKGLKCKHGIYVLYKTDLDLKFKVKFPRKKNKIKGVNPDGTFQKDLKILVNPNGYYLQVPYDEEIKVYDTTSKPKSFISLDPGYRTFLTGVDYQGNIKEYGKDWYDGITKELKRIDKLKSKLSRKINPLGHYRSLKTKKILDRKFKKVVNKIDDMHKKITKDLSRYDLVIMPKLDTKSVVKRQGLDKKFNRKAYHAGHCKFHDYAKMKLREKLNDEDERFTTITCSNCFKRSHVGPSKVFNCQYCGFTSDRDVNSCLNILYKNYQYLS